MKVPSPGKLKEGFTLLEVVTVIGLLAIVAVAVAPSLSDFGSGAGASVANIVSADIRRTQKSAMTRGGNRSIEFLGQQYKYDIPVTGEGLSRDISAISATSTFAEPAVITFNAMGEPVTATFLITITDGADLYEVAVEPISGKVTIR